MSELNKAILDEYFDTIIFNRRKVSSLSWRFSHGNVMDLAQKADVSQFSGIYERYLNILKKHDYSDLVRLSDRKIIVSLTSFPERITVVHKAIQSLFDQSLKADKIVLWLADSQFPDREKELPEELMKLVSAGQLEIDWCRDLKPHKKYLYSLKKYPDDIIITVDDDLVQPEDLIEKLYLSYLENPESVSCTRVHLMLFDKEEKLIPYARWIKEASDCLYRPSMQLLATGGAGALYPPGLLKKEYLDEELIQDLCPLADDLWLKTVELLSDVPVVLGYEGYKLNVIDDSQGFALFSVNGAGKKNDEQIRKIRNWMLETFGKDMFAEKILHTDIGEYLNDPYTVIDFLFSERRKLKLQINDLKKELKELKKNG